ncbi:lipopolysaccharide-induced tumor necrosis factor-alpha factor homolog isoform X2 [Labeo rohita]|uniref:lipopolysaccharide-induced tumor necrosis factor-alpha factor homolog isoform X2 n=1 Tax=Labeo rohita TaxID=84645 RepID=UPI0021E2361C|nr:lipopolysaccharide-induced tumor necrosis factor-alpha factor homolog isoform X2 [Labeo rohita]
MTPVLPQDSEQDGDLWNILFRRQQLQNRHQFLQEIQKKNNRIEEYLANEDGPSELDRIEEELKLLEQKEKDLIQKKTQSLATHTDKDPIQAPFQGLYILPVSSTEIPPIIPVQEENTETVSPTIEENTEPPDPPISLDDVTVSPAKVKCPTCQKIVTTEIHYKLGSNAFLFCCLLSVVGCLAGCCLVPFCMNRFKDVTHRCPSCHSHICSVDRI